MDPKILESVNRLVEELKKRIELLTSTTTRANLNEESYNTILEIIDSYIHTTPSRLTVDDFINFKITDMEKILDLIALPKEKDRMLSMFSANVAAIRATSSENRIAELAEFIEPIIKMILDYITDYEEFHNNQDKLQSTKVTEYKKYIEIFTSESFSRFFEEEDQAKLLKLMANFAMPIRDRRHILQYIAKQNIKVPSRDNSIFDEDYINLSYRVSSVTNKYLVGNSHEKEIIKSELEGKDIDIDLIPSIAEAIAKSLGLKDHETNNIIIAIVLNNLFSAYTEALEQGKDEENKDEEYIASLKSKIEDVLNIEIIERNRFIEEARAILAEKQEFYNNSTETEKDVDQYVDTLVSELEAMGYDHETATDLKTLPLIKSMSETLDKLDKLDSESADYNLCCNVLKQLIEEYHKLQDKKDLKTTKQ